MNKKKILILAICAVVVIAGAIAATVLLRDGLNTAGDETTTTTTQPATEYVYETYYQDVFEPVTDEDASAVTEEDGNVLTTLKQIVQTTKKVVNKNPAKPNKNNTTKKPTTTKKNSTTQLQMENIVDAAIGEDGNSFLGYRKSPEGYYYTDDKDCWQENAGYNEIYDNMAAMIMMNIDQVRIRFTYGDHDWMIQLWKGQYGNLLVGAEIGVYTTDAGTYTGEIGAVNHYDCADKEDWLKMEMTMYWSEGNNGTYKKAFSRNYEEYWWCTGFVKGQLTKYTAPRSELKLKARITFKSTEMANLFVAGLKESGFARAMGSSQLADDSYYQKGADVWFLWSTKYHECFVGYGDVVEE